MLTLLAAIFTIIWFLFTKGIWILGFTVIVRSDEFKSVATRVTWFVKGLISRASA